MKNVVKILQIIAILALSHSCTPLGDLSEINLIAAELAFDKQEYSFGEVGVGSAAVAKFTLSNTSEVDAVECGDLELSDDTNFSIQSSTCNSLEMLPHESCEVEILSRPQSLGTKSLTVSRKCKNTEVATTANQTVAIASDLDWSPLTKDFGSVYVGANSITETFTLTNNGSVSATGCSAPVLSDPVNFEFTAVSSLINGELPAGASLTAVVRAKPQSIGKKKAHIYVNCATRGGTISTTPNQIKVEGVYTNLAWSPQSYDFGTVNVGNGTIDQQFVLSNTGVATASLCGLVTLSDTTNFFITADTCGINDMAQGATCMVRVSGSPQSGGLKQATLSRTCSYGGTVQTLVDQITVTGHVPTIAWTPQGHDFGIQTLGVPSVSQTFTLTNSTALSATMCWAPYLDDWTGTFAISNDTCANNDLLASQSCSVDITATPTSYGYTRATLYRDCWSAGTFSTQSQQIVVFTDGPYLEANPSSVNLGNVDPGQNTSNQTIVFTNTGTQGDANCTLYAPWDTANFTLVSTTCGGSIASGASCSAVVRGHPQGSNSYSDYVSYYCDNSGAYAGLSLTGNGPEMAWTPASPNLGNVDIGQQSTNLVLTLTNSGSVTATNCLTYMNDGTHFTLMSTTCGTTLAANGGTCSATVRAHPQTTGPLLDYIVYACDEGYGYTDLNVTGKGPELAWNPASHNFGGIDVGLHADLVLTLTNSGSVSATGCGAPYFNDGTHFTLMSTTCGPTLAANGGVCTATVRAQPQTAGSYTDYIISDCNEGSGYTDLTVTGNGPLLGIDNPSYNFGSVNVGDTSPAPSFHFTNSGNQDATGCSAPTLTDNTHFSIVNDTCGTNDLAQGGSCAIQIQAHPVSGGAKQATLSRTCTFGGTVSGTTNGILVTGVVNAPDLSWTLMAEDYGNVLVGANSYTQIFYLVNNGTQPATGCSVPVISDAVNFSIIGDTCSTNNLSGYGTNCMVYIRANPQSAGAKQTTLSRSCTVGGAVSTTANGIIANGVITASWMQEFGLSSLGQIRSGGGESDNYKFYFINKNDQSLSGCSAASLTNSNDFSIVSDGCGAGTTAANKICAVEVKANPLVVGAVTTTLSRACSETGTISTSIYSEGMDNSPVVKISTAWITSCVLTAAGKTKCWGGSSQSTKPLEISVVSGLTDIDTAVGGHACGIESPSGAVKCWDFDTISSTLTPDIGLNNAVSISTAMFGGMGHSTCAVISDGTIKCWGNNVYGQLGDGTNTSTATPVTVSGVTNAVKVSIGYEISGVGAGHACAVLSDSTIKCWGYNNKGQLGNASLTNSTVPVVVSGINNAVDVKVSGAHSCALLSDSTVKCWGYNGSGQVGNGTTNVGGVSVPVTVAGVSSAVKVMVDEYSVAGTCALLSNNTLKCWGGTASLSYGGSCFTWPCTTPYDFTAYTNISDAAIGDSVCSVLTDNTVKCTGGNYYNSLAAYDITTLSMISWGQIRPTIVRGVSGVVELSSRITNCARLTSGEVKCWGQKSGPLLGYYRTNSSGSFSGAHEAMPSVSGITTAVSIGSGDSTNCAVLSNGTIKCWGYNDYGQVGNGSGAIAYIPATVTGVSNAVTVSAGYNHNCAVLNNGTIKCWGSGTYGQLGDGNATSSNVPVVVSGITTASEVSVGDYFTCASLTDNTVKCWGFNYYGQVGDGTGGIGTNKNTPVAVSGVTNAVSVRVGNASACALLSTGEVKCWGYNYAGQLGDGTNTDSTTPVLVQGITNAVELSVGAGSACARLSTGDVKCWGGNTYGQLGIMVQSTSNVLTPKFEVSLGPVSSLSNGFRAVSRCDVLSTGEVQCYGNADPNNPMRGFLRDFVHQIKGL